MKKSKFIGIAIIYVFVGFFFCVNNDNVGNTTQTGNPTIAGILYQSDGSTPASNADVYLRKKNSLINVFSGGVRKKLSDTAVVMTDSEGRFSIDSVDDGTYVIECTDGVNYALYDSVVVKNMDSQVNLPADTLKPAGSIKGVVKVAEGGDPRNVYILAFGIDRFTTVNEDGSFKLKSLSEGTYDLRIISALQNYGTIDTTQIKVLSGDTTNLDTIELPFIGIPSLKNVAVKYDTLKRIAHLSWSKIDTSLIMGFNVYRKNKHSDTIFSKINAKPIADSFFPDSTVLQDQTYSYRVSFVKKDSTESVKSPEISVMVGSYFLVDTTIAIGVDGNSKRDFQRTMVSDKKGLFYIVKGTGVQVVDSDFTLIRRLRDTLLLAPREVATDDNGRVFVSNIDVSTRNIKNILVFNQEGVREKVISIYDVDSLGNQHGIGIQTSIFTIDSRGRIIFASNKPSNDPNINHHDSLYVCDSSGEILVRLGGYGLETGPSGDYGIVYIATDKNSNIYVYDVGIGIKIYDSLGVFKHIINTNSMTVRNQTFYDPRIMNTPIFNISGFAIEPQTNRIFLMSNGNILSVYNVNGEFIYQYNSQTIGNYLNNIVIIGNKIYVSSNVNVVKLNNNLP
jgi:hypothetical protein